MAAQTLRVLAGLIGTRDDAGHDEEPGKVIHELRVGEVARLKLSPLARYYGTVDATPLFLCLLCDARDWPATWRCSGSSSAQVEAMLGWIDGPGDRDGDGLLEYRQRAPDRPAQPGLEGLRRGRARRARRAARAAGHARRAAGLRVPREAAARAAVRARRRRRARGGAAARGGRAARAARALLAARPRALLDGLRRRRRGRAGRSPPTRATCSGGWPSRRSARRRSATR